MAGRDTTPQAIEAPERGRQRPGRRALRPWLAVLAAVWLSTSPAAAVPADAVKGEVSVSTANGFARLVFRLAEDVEAETRVSGGVLVISFKRPIDISVEGMNAGARDYISASRRDPDGRGIRIALTQKVTVNAMAAGEKLFVDLLPDGWKGLPPGLPQDVVEELARRARDAERRIRQERLVNQQKKQVPIRVRVARQPTFTRYVFDLPGFVPVTADRAKDKLTLLFGGSLKFDLGDVQATLPGIVQSVDSKPDGETVSVQFAFRGAVDVRTFREDNSFIVDVVTEGPRAQDSPKPKETAKLIAAGAKITAAAQAPEAAAAKAASAPSPAPVSPPASRPRATPEAPEAATSAKPSADAATRPRPPLRRPTSCAGARAREADRRGGRDATRRAARDPDAGACRAGQARRRATPTGASERASRRCASRRCARSRCARSRCVAQAGRSGGARKRRQGAGGAAPPRRHAEAGISIHGADPGGRLPPRRHVVARIRHRRADRSRGPQ